MVSVSVFRCCTTDDGAYWGAGVHDPAMPSDGPWYLAVVPDDDGARVEWGFGTRDDALAKLDELVDGGLAVETAEVEDAYAVGI